ncbi:DNA-binding transcriptional regulator YbjK [Gordonia hydrophobica]|nr:DNA-binding transcriptional regulator YbjK [Gordonia hydrophobica]
MSNRAIAAEAGVSLGSLTYHFASQDDLLAAALSMFVDEEVARLTAIAGDPVTSSGADSAIARTVDVVEANQRSAEQVAQLELYLHASRDVAVRSSAARCYAAYDELAVRFLEANGIAEAGKYAPLISSVIDGVELRRLAVSDGGPDLRLALRVLLAGIRAESSQRVSPA